MNSPSMLQTQGTPEDMDRILSQRRRMGWLFEKFALVAACLGALMVLTLVIGVLKLGLPRLSWDFLTHMPSRIPKLAGIKAALFGSLWLVMLTVVIAVPVGVGAGIFLEEFSKKGRLSRFLQLNISNLAGVPSIVFGMLGLALFVRFFDLGRSLISGALTLSLLVLPVIIVATQEAFRAIPNSIRYAAFALGATRWQIVRDHLLPSALPGIMTGTILALSRALGETAPLILVGALAYVPFIPTHPSDSFSALPMQIYNWAARPQAAFHELAASAIIVLLVVLTLLNSVALWVRARFSRRNKW